MNRAPKSNRLHIGLFGKCNSGKSSLINAITGQYTAIVSETPGTTTDLVNKNMEIAGIGPVVLIDTAGFDDTGSLGRQRLEQTKRAIPQTDIAIIVCRGSDITEEVCWMEMFAEQNVPVIAVINTSDRDSNLKHTADYIEKKAGFTVVMLNALTGEGIDRLIRVIEDRVQAGEEKVSITGNLVAEGDVVMLVMPQDIQAPQGRLILPQAQTIRELLDKNCIVAACTPQKIKETLTSLSAPPKLVITDSQVFDLVSKLIPKESKLTSFSVLFAHYKGDIKSFVEGVNAIDRLTENSKVLIAEACSHAPLSEDIGRVKIPGMLRQRVGEGLQVEIKSGLDFPDDLTGYDLIIHCGACMFNRRNVLSRIAKAKQQQVPITNYGVTVAYLKGILDKVVYPG